jgi:predicted amidohydrolase YtcJ
MYYAVTGRNARGVLINGDQTISRQDILRMYTASNGWFLREENQLGSIEVGRLGDLVVLNQDYFNPTTVPDEAIKKTSSVMSVVGGRIVHDTGAVK